MQHDNWKNCRWGLTRKYTIFLLQRSPDDTNCVDPPI